MKLTLLTGNKGKVAEWQRLLPATIELTNHEVDSVEIQSLDLTEIVADKARRAYEQLGVPVVVEDVAAGLEKLGWLPGPFIKFFMKKLGNDVLFTLAGQEGAAAKTACAIAYYDGNTRFTVLGEVHGTVVEPRGSSGFGFDMVFVPNGSTKSYAQMAPAEKDAVSHRGKAIALFVDELARRGMV